MKYKIEITKRALKDLKKIDQKNAANILNKIEHLSDDLTGDIKKLTDFTPEYRLRVGNYRVLFDVDNNVIRVYRVKHRREVYR